MPIIKVHPNSESELQEIADALAQSRKVVILTGAGISTNCGIPDFRSKDGLYSLIQNQYDSALKCPPWKQSNTFDIDDRPKKKRKHWYYEVVAPDGRVVDVIDDDMPQRTLQEHGSRHSSTSLPNDNTTQSVSKRSHSDSFLNECNNMKSLRTISSDIRKDYRCEKRHLHQYPAHNSLSHAKLKELDLSSNSLEILKKKKSPQSPKITTGVGSTKENSLKTRQVLNKNKSTRIKEVDQNDSSSKLTGLDEKEPVDMLNDSGKKCLDECQSSHSSLRTLPNLKGRDLFDALIWSDPFKTSIFYMFMTSFRKKVQLVQSTSEAHRFFKTLRDSGRLVRNYTQNIDCFEEKEGLSTDLKLGPGNRARFRARNLRMALTENPSQGSDQFRGVEAVLLHGSLSKLRCGVCSQLCDWDEDDRLLITSRGSAPDCPHCTAKNTKRRNRGCRALAVGRLRPDVVLYGEEHPNSSLISPLVTHDLGLRPDILLIMGTSLKVHGLKVLVKEFAKAVHDRGGKVIFVNHTQPPESIWSGVIDYWVNWDCDKWVLDLKERKREIWLPQGSINSKVSERRQNGHSQSKNSKRSRSQVIHDDQSSGAYLVFKIMSSLAQEDSDSSIKEGKFKFNRRSFSSYAKRSIAPLKEAKTKLIPQGLKNCFLVKSSSKFLGQKESQPIDTIKGNYDPNLITSYISKNWSKYWKDFVKENPKLQKTGVS
ncbi:putative hst3 protein [Golovinomyces cichoracearum]|uniref:Putative hst3 protein n=1 Tax=Golovinomyces cichoracearum TaxID=62708 RepID=A0A420IC48_9PEZI|nr:putative hst3 protein [Golovinomyces cichoracearum]